MDSLQQHTVFVFTNLLCAFPSDPELKQIEKISFVCQLCLKFSFRDFYFGSTWKIVFREGGDSFLPSILKIDPDLFLLGKLSFFADIFYISATFYIFFVLSAN